MKEQAVKEKMRLPDLMTEASYMKQKKTSRTRRGRIENKEGNRTSKTESQNQ